MVCPHSPRGGGGRATAAPCLRAEQVDALLGAFFMAVKVDPSALTLSATPAPASAGAALAAAACARATAAATAAPSTPPRPRQCHGKAVPPAPGRVPLGYVFFWWLARWDRGGGALRRGTWNT